MRRLTIVPCVALSLAACAVSTTPTPPPSEMAGQPSAASATATPDVLANPTVDGLFVVDDDGRRIAVRCWGEGPVIVLEGGGAGTEQFSEAQLVRELAGEARVCVHDRAGIGLSDPAPDRRRDADDVVEDLAAALDAAEVEPPYVVVGSSFGGMVVTHFAERFGQEVAGVVTLDTPAPSLELTPENFPEGVWDHPDNVENLDVVEGFENRFALDPPHFDAPLIVVVASGGQSNVEDQSFWLQSSPDSRVLELTGGHEIYADAAADVATEIRSLLPNAET